MHGTAAGVRAVLQTARLQKHSLIPTSNWRAAGVHVLSRLPCPCLCHRLLTLAFVASDCSQRLQPATSETELYSRHHKHQTRLAQFQPLATLRAQQSCPAAMAILFAVERPTIRSLLHPPALGSLVPGLLPLPRLGQTSADASCICALHVSSTACPSPRIALCKH
ncbi:hypothetical protein L1887_54931 [Cichorium endivia]|nr:hypothetical protein L1887_54931 [Cichorium endivia]